MSLSVRVGQFQTDLRFRIRHASADRSATENIIVELADDHGRRGYGEGCPRDYVTGETIESGQAFLREHGRDIAANVDTVETLKGWIDANERLIDANPAAFAAIELAALDMLGQRSNQPLEAIIGAPPLTTPVRYSGVIGDGSPAKTRLISYAHRLLGFRDFKIKLGGDVDGDRRRLKTLPKGVRLRADANNLWPTPADCMAHATAVGQPFWAIEEPVTVGDDTGMREIAAALGVKIILDESLTHRGQLARFDADPAVWIANIRVSKCGGIIRGAQLARQAQTLGLGVILGAHVGETSLLTRAALAVGQSLGNPPLAREGGYGTILLKSDIGPTSLRLGYGGRLDPQRFGLATASGMGLAVDPGRLDWQT